MPRLLSVADRWKRAGLCGKCGRVQTHKKIMMIKTPLVRGVTLRDDRPKFHCSLVCQLTSLPSLAVLVAQTVDGEVYKGKCLRCHSLTEAKHMLNEPVEASDSSNMTSYHDADLPGRDSAAPPHGHRSDPQAAASQPRQQRHREDGELTGMSIRDDHDDDDDDDATMVSMISMDSVLEAETTPRGGSSSKQMNMGTIDERNSDGGAEAGHSPGQQDDWGRQQSGSGVRSVSTAGQSSIDRLEARIRAKNDADAASRHGGSRVHQRTGHASSGADGDNLDGSDATDRLDRSNTDADSRLTATVPGAVPSAGTDRLAQRVREKTAQGQNSNSQHQRSFHSSSDGESSIDRLEARIRAKNGAAHLDGSDVDRLDRSNTIDRSNTDADSRAAATLPGAVPSTGTDSLAKRVME